MSPLLDHTAGEKDALQLNRMIAVCRDGHRFYQSAAMEVEDQTVRNLFLGMAELRASLVGQLEPLVEGRGVDANDKGTVEGRLRSWYLESLKHFKRLDDLTFIEEVERVERRTLKEFRGAVKRLHDELLARKVSAHIASLQMTHDRMRGLKDIKQRRGY